MGAPEDPGPSSPDPSPNPGSTPSERLRLLGAAVEAAANPIVITDVQGTIEWVNGAFTQVTGYTREEAVGRNPRDLVRSGLHDEAFYGELWETILKGRVWQGRMVNRRKDGSLYQEEQTITPVRSPEGVITHFIAVKVDVSERQELEEELRQSQKMQAVGRLAGGIAHDFNNLLTVIRGYAQMALEALPPDSSVQQDVSQILEEVGRAGALTRQLLAFSRRQVMKEEVLDLGDTVRGMEDMLRRLIPERIELRCERGEEPFLVEADPSQLQQVVMNLAVNAADAIENRGKITFRMGKRTLSESEAAEVPWRVEPGPYVRLTVADTGCGMSEEIRERIFDPFFTTKPQGKGTGLGLSTVYGIVKQSRGHILVESEPGTGSAFHVLLPQFDGAATSHDPKAHGEGARRDSEGEERGGAPAEETEGEGSGGGSTILLVEDEASVRRVASRLLGAAGYSVLEATNGTEALELAASHASEIDVVLSDVVMPEMGGAELLEGLRRINPDLSVVLMSGYSEEELSEGIRETATAFLDKPFSGEELTAVVRAALKR